MNIHALKVTAPYAQMVYDSLVSGEARFGWSYIKTADIRELQRRIEKDGILSLSEEERDCYQEFLLDIQPEDFLVFINVPERGRCTVARVKSVYFWRWEDREDSDFNHRFEVYPDSVFDFDRNDRSVHPSLSARLKLQGRHWQIYTVKEFHELLGAQAKRQLGKPSTPADQLQRLKRELAPLLRSATEQIHKTYPSHSLEELIHEVLSRSPGVVDVQRLRGRADRGADLLAVIERPHPITGSIDQSTCVIQVKSYEGEHWDIRAAEDIERAFEAHPEATEGLIVSTATAPGQTLEDELDRVREETGRPVHVLIGPDVAALVLRLGWDLLRDQGSAS